MNNRVVNMHYIAVIREKGGVLEYCEEEIVQNKDLLDKLEKMCENPTITIWDVLNECFNHFAPKDDKESYNYLIDPYYSTYVSQIRSPKTFIQKFQEERNSYKENLEKEILEKKGLEKEKIEKEKIEKKVGEWERNIMRKKTLLEKIRKYVYARNYYIKELELESDEKVKIYSTNKIGWNSFEYKISDDISIIVCTNFGYGISSYFCCKMKYKDLLIVPYSLIVQYYHIFCTEIIYCTRSYSPIKENWEHLLNFVAESANMAKFEPEKFIKEWLLGEIKKMIEGLELIIKDPEKVFKKFLNDKDNKIEAGLFGLARNFSEEDMTEYKMLPYEKIMAFKAEKISEVLFFIDNLEEIKRVSPVVDEYISTIVKLCSMAQFEIKDCITTLYLDIKKANIEMENMEMEIKEINASPYFVRIREIEKEIEEEEEKERKKKEEMKEKSEKTYYHIQFLSPKPEKVEKLLEEKECLVNNSEYKELFSKRKSLYDTINILRRTCNLRYSFGSTLWKCKEKIEKNV